METPTMDKNHTNPPHLSLRIGWRTAKTGISVGICLLIAAIFQYKMPFYACVAAVLAMRATPKQSVEYGIQRTIGTLVGGCIALLYLLAVQRFLFLNSAYAQALLIPCALVLGVFICNALKQKDAGCSSCCVVILSVVLASATSNPYLFALKRTLETIAGIVIAVVVNRIIQR